MSNTIFPVRPLATADDSIVPLRIIGKAASEAEAIALCEQEGFTVIREGEGGLVELSVDRVDEDGNEHMAWVVTVEPE